MEQKINELLKELEFEDDLVATVVQDHKTDRVLMLAYMNPLALEKTIEKEVAHYWSRSRGELWKKGEKSGNTQIVKEIRVDCDGDALLLKVDQKIGACHTGHYSCFFRRYEDKELKIVDEEVFDPNEVYGE